MREKDFNRLGMSIKEFNNQSVEFKLHTFKGDFYNPFDLPNNPRIMNPFTFKIFGGEWEDGSHLLVHMMSGKVWRRLQIKNNNVFKAERLDDDYRWVEIKKPWSVDSI